MEDSPAGIRRACIAIAGERHAGSAGDGGDGGGLARQLSAAFARACVAAGIDRALIDEQVASTEQVAVLPAGIDEPRVLARLIGELAAVVRRLGDQCGPGGRTRMALAVHEGLTIVDGDGFGGQAIATARRLADCDELQAALAGEPHADLIVLLSERIFDDLTELDRLTLSASPVRRIEISNPACPQTDIGWIFTP